MASQKTPSIPLIIHFRQLTNSSSLLIYISPGIFNVIKEKAQERESVHHIHAEHLVPRLTFVQTLQDAKVSQECLQILSGPVAGRAAWLSGREDISFDDSQLMFLHFVRRIGTKMKMLDTGLDGTVRGYMDNGALLDQVVPFSQVGFPRGMQSMLAWGAFERLREKMTLEFAQSFAGGLIRIAKLVRPIPCSTKIDPYKLIQAIHPRRLYESDSGHHLIDEPKWQQAVGLIRGLCKAFGYEVPHPFALDTDNTPFENAKLIFQSVDWKEVVNLEAPIDHIDSSPLSLLLEIGIDNVEKIPIEFKSESPAPAKLDFVLFQCPMRDLSGLFESYKSSPSDYSGDEVRRIVIAANRNRKSYDSIIRYVLFKGYHKDWATELRDPEILIDTFFEILVAMECLGSLADPRRYFQNLFNNDQTGSKDQDRSEYQGTLLDLHMSMFRSSQACVRRAFLNDNQAHLSQFYIDSLGPLKGHLSNAMDYTRLKKLGWSHPNIMVHFGFQLDSKTLEPTTNAKQLLETNMSCDSW